MPRTIAYPKLLSAVAIFSLLSACAGQSTAQLTASQTPETASTTTGSNDTATETSDSETSNSIESVYTPLDLERCQVLETYAESGGRSLRCNGYQDISLYVTEETARFDVDMGIPNDEWITGGLAYNTIGNTVEWRIHNGQPVAAILRYHFMDDGIDPTSWSALAVTSIGREDSPGCLVAWVKADAQPNQNTAARQIADQQAKDFDCDGSDRSSR